MLLIEEYKNRPLTKSQSQAVIVDPRPMVEVQKNWEQIAIEAAAQATNPTIDVDTPDNSDLRSNTAPMPIGMTLEQYRVQVNAQGQPMMYDERSETWFPININIPNQNNSAPTTPAVDEKEKRQQLIMIFAGMLVLLLIILFLMNRKK